MEIAALHLDRIALVISLCYPPLARQIGVLLRGFRALLLCADGEIEAVGVIHRFRE